MEGDRRRHARSRSAVRVHIEVEGATLAVTRVADLSAGGALVEVEPGSALPALGARVQARLVRDDRAITRGARVVRLRWTGRERGVPMPPAVALVFDDGDAMAAARLAELRLFED